MSFFPADMPQTTQQEEEKEQSMNSESELSSLQAGCEEEDGDTCEEGQEVEEEEEQCEETPEDEEVKVEWPTGVPQASDKDLAKLSHQDGVGLHKLIYKPLLLLYR